MLFALGGPTIRTTVEVAATRAEAWERLSSIEDHPSWMADAVAVRFTGASRRGVGTTFECDTKVGPLRLTDTMEVVEWEELDHIAVRHTGLVRGSGRFSLLPSHTGPVTTTLIRWEEALTMPSWLGGRAAARVAAPVLRSIWRGNLERLRDRIEGQISPARPA